MLYLDFDSTYRNRNEFPLPAEFDLILSQTGRKSTKTTALDPVSDAMPITAWISTDFNQAGANTITATVVANASTSSTFLTTNASFQPIDGYYVGAQADDGTTQTRVVEYKVINTGVAIITVSPAFSAVPVSFTINDPTVITSNNPLVFVPNGAVGNNAYKGFYLYNETASSAGVLTPQQDYRVINFYDADTRLVGVDATNSVSSWTASDSFSIRKELPVIVATTAVGTTVSTLVLSTIIRGNISPTNDFYKGDFVRIKSTGDVRRIISYTGSTTTLTVFPAFDSVFLAEDVEILLFSRDNFNPFSYTGSQVSQQQEVCYELELLDIVLPNQILKSSNGARIAFYPYVYVELTNKSNANTNILYSNNPNATKMLWRVAIDDITNQTSSLFIKNDCDGAKQTIKFKPNDNLHFSVRLPSGELFETEISEFYSPSAPNPLIQISGLCSIKRL